MATCYLYIAPRIKVKLSNSVPITMKATASLQAMTAADKSDPSNLANSSGASGLWK